MTVSYSGNRSTVSFLAELVLSLVIYGETLTSWKVTKNRFPVNEIEFVVQPSQYHP